MAAPRYLEKFTSLDGSTTVFTFPLYSYEYQPGQGLRSPTTPISGANYPFRHLGNAPALKAAGTERVRFKIVQSSSANLDTDVDEMRSELYNIGLGKLWTLGADGTRRWCFAEVAEMPSYTVTPTSLLLLPVIIGFIRYSDWYGSSATSSSGTMGSAVVINNPGNAPVYNATLILKGTYTNPQLTNANAVLADGVTTYKLQSSRDGSSSNHWLKFDAGEDSVEYSSDGGSNYADDYANFVRQSGQVGLMKLVPGNNSISGTGVSGSTTLAWAFYGAYH